MGERYAILGSYENDLALVKTERGKLGFKGRNEKKDIPCRFDRAESFDKAYALVAIQGLWGLIDTDGNEVIEIKCKSPAEVYKEKEKRAL